MRFLSITKPGIIFGNVLTLSGGFFVATHHVGFNFSVLGWSILGMAFVVASGCVFNNVIDRDIDRLMERTRQRVLVQGLISGKLAIFYAIILGILGASILYFKTNPLTCVLALIGLFFYVLIYSLWLKRSSPYGAMVGAIAGALPPVIGYCAMTNQLDRFAVLLFLILFFWQMPHFYAIAIYRLRDYQVASIPVLPTVRGVSYTKRSILIYITLFIVAAVSLGFFKEMGWPYGLLALGLGLFWLYKAVRGFKTQPDELWARKVFLSSIIVITFLSLGMLL